jgi:hypothetical protein
MRVNIVCLHVFALTTTCVFFGPANAGEPPSQRNYTCEYNRSAYHQVLPLLAFDTFLHRYSMPRDCQSLSRSSSPICPLKSAIGKPASTTNLFSITDTSRNTSFRRDSSNILACIPTTNIFIEAGIESGGVLVHCFGGKSRSAAFVCAYIMSSLNCAFDEAYSTLKSARPIVEINAGFECQLRAYHAANCDVYLAQQLLLRIRIRAMYKQHQMALQAAQDSTQPPSQGGSPPQRGLFLDTSTSGGTTTSAAAEPESTTTGSAAGAPAGSEGGMDVESNSPEGHSASHGKGLANLTISTAAASQPSSAKQPLSNSPKYDSFYYQRDHNMLPDMSSRPSMSFSKLATTVEDSPSPLYYSSGASGLSVGLSMSNLGAEREPEFTFSKTRSISDVYEDSRDPCLEVPDAQGQPDNPAADAREEEEKATYAMLQRKLHYVADSPSAASLQAGTTAGPGSLLPGFAALSTSTLPTGLNLNINTGGNSTGSAGLKGLGLGLSIGTGAEDSAVQDGHQQQWQQMNNHGMPQLRSIGAGFMQGSGNSAGNRTHRASALNNRNKGNYSVSTFRRRKRGVPCTA